MCAQSENKAFPETFRHITRTRDLIEEIEVTRRRLDDMTHEFDKIYADCLCGLRERPSIDIVREISIQQANYYAKLLFIYQSTLDYVDSYSIAKLFCLSHKDTKCVRNRRATIQKFLGCEGTGGWRRGSPEIKEIVEVKRPEKRGRGSKTLYKPTGFFEAWARLNAYYNTMLTTLRDTWALLEDYWETEYYGFPLQIKEHQKRISNFENILYSKMRFNSTSWVENITDEKIVNELRELEKGMNESIFEIEKFCMKFLPVLKGEIDRLRERRALLEDVLVQTKETINSLTQKINALNTVTHDFFLELRRTGTFEFRSIELILGFKDYVMIQFETLFNLIDDMIFNYKLSSSALAPTSLFETSIEELKTELDKMLKRKQIDEIKYNERKQKIVERLQGLLGEEQEKRERWVLKLSEWKN